jgi:hypothetical protein
MEISSRNEKNRYDGGCDPINNHAERRPPSRIRDELSAILPKILDAVAH